VERVWLSAASLHPGCPLVAVSSADGGVGRSTLVAALGGVLALACPLPVLAVDLSGRAWGGLAERVGRRHAATIWDAVSNVGSLTNRDAVERLVQHGPTCLQALIGEVALTRRRRSPTAEDGRTVLARLRALYPLAVLDLPAADTPGTWTTMADAAAPVLVARATPDSLRHVLRLLTALRAVGLGAIAGRSVLVVNATSPHVPRELRAVERHAARAAGALIRVPYDTGLARPAPVDPRGLRRATRVALIDLAAAVLARCPADPRAAAMAVGQPATQQAVEQAQTAVDKGESH